MSELLEQLLTDLRAADGDRAPIITAAISAEGVDRDALAAAAVDRFNAVRPTVADSDTAVADLELLAEIHNGITAFCGSDCATTTIPAPGNDTATTATTETAPSVNTDTAPDAALTGEILPPAAPAPVAASLTTTAPFGQLSHTGPRGNGVATVRHGYTLQAKRDLSDLRAGANVDKAADLGRLAVDALTALQEMGGTDAQRTPIAAWSYTGNGQIITPDMPVAQVGQILDQNVDLSRIAFDAKTKTFGAGFCSPSEIDYNVCPPADVADLWDVPSITVRRGGVRYPVSEDFSTVYGSGVGCWTEAEEIARTEDKPCYMVDCPDFEEIRLNICSLCIQAPMLTAWGYPEWVAAAVTNRLAAFEHRLSANLIAAAAASATVVAPINPPGTGDAPYGPGLAALVFGYVELQATDMRYRHRWAQSRPLEVVFPAWFRGALRSDITKRAGWDSIAKTDQYINEKFAAINVRPQWVVNWQDAFASGTATDMGGTTPPTTWPARVKFLLYPAGAFQRARGEITRVSGVRNDPQLLRQNVELALFLEVYWGLISRCPEARLLDIPVCPTGMTGGTGTNACPAV